MSKVSVIDCAVETLTNNCFNRLVDNLEIALRFHCPSMFGMDSLKGDDSSAYIVFGSYSNIEDRLEWHKDLAQFLDEKLKSGIPVLGICFGHQLMADYYGSDIERNENSQYFQGVRKVSLENNRSMSFFVAHNFQIKKIANCFNTLGSSNDCAHEIIQHKEYPFTGIQGHPEASTHFVNDTLKDIHIEQIESRKASLDGITFIKDFLDQYDLL
ncbi:type 1 glutamine amidotransferase [Halobacteriovorax marinus]|uniref:type 1 glutamine amidotransferase n=1 Tax=Halobacteriovorax marinus TaxID=97084 RepID=UPI003A9210D9